MIVTDLKNINQQLKTSKHFATAFDFLKRGDLASLPEGRVVVDGTNVYVEVQSYTTKPLAEAKYEAHRQYADIQYVLSGEEHIGWTPIENLRITSPYNAERDFLFGEPIDENITLARLKAGQFAVLWPSDAHAPRLVAGESQPVKKLVVKVAVS